MGVCVQLQGGGDMTLVCVCVCVCVQLQGGDDMTSVCVVCAATRRG